MGEPLGEVVSEGVPFPGIPVQIGARQLVMPPLNAKAARLYMDRVVALQRGEESDPLGLAAAVVHACLKRNYPALTLDEVEEAVDFDNFDAMLARATGRGAFKKWCEAVAAAAAQEGTEGNPRPQPTPPAPDGTGATSTPASPPPPDGGSPTSTS